MFTTPAVVGDLVYSGSCSGVFFAFSAGDGEPVWRYDTRDDGEPAQFHGNPIVTDRLVVTPSDATAAGYVYAFERATGEPVWKQPVDGGIVTDLLRAGPSALGVSGRGELTSLGLDDGSSGGASRPKGNASPSSGRRRRRSPSIESCSVALTAPSTRWTLRQAPRAGRSTSGSASRPP